MKLLILIPLCFAIPAYAAETTADKEACKKVARETPVTHPAKAVEEQKIAYAKCMQKKKQTHAPSKS